MATWTGAPPVSREGFTFVHNEFFADSSNRTRHRRATPAELQAHYNTPGSDRERTAHWYEAQLIHYGLPASKAKATARMRLFDAVQAGQLAVPARIGLLEREMKKEWAKSEREAKKAGSGGGGGETAVAAKGKGKRKADDDDVDGARAKSVKKAKTVAVKGKETKPKPAVKPAASKAAPSSKSAAGPAKRPAEKKPAGKKPATKKAAGKKPEEKSIESKPAAKKQTARRGGIAPTRGRITPSRGGSSATARGGASASHSTCRDDDDDGKDTYPGPVPAHLVHTRQTAPRGRAFPVRGRIPPIGAYSGPPPPYSELELEPAMYDNPGYDDEDEDDFDDDDDEDDNDSYDRRSEYSSDDAHARSPLARSGVQTGELRGEWDGYSEREYERENRDRWGGSSW